MRIKVYQTNLAAGLPLPARSFLTDVGFNIATAIDFTVDGGESVKVPTGLVFDLPTRQFKVRTGLFSSLPARLMLQIEQRTGNGGRGLFPAATIVDPGYRPDPEDEAGLTLWLRNVGKETLAFKRGDNVVQGLFVLCITPTIVQVPARLIRWDTDRGAGRFGSTGR
jgi:dUTPase